MDMTTQMTTELELCPRCLAGASGVDGHERLTFYVSGPYPGHSIFKCQDCGDRWIRHYGGNTPYAWTRYAKQFAGAMRKPRATPVQGG